MPDSSLPLSNARHESFAQLMAQGGMSQGRAYLGCYKDSSLNAAYVGASRLLRNAKVSARIAYLQEQGAERASVNVGLVVAGLMENAEAAFERGAHMSSVRSLELLGRHLGMWK